MAVGTLTKSGYRFCPTEPELIRDYLLPRAMGSLIKWDEVMDCDLYGDLEPKDLFFFWNRSKESRERVIYVFTRVKNVSKCSYYVQRAVAKKGTWKGTGARKQIHFEGKCIGWKRSLVYEDISKKKMGYNMNEYSLNDTVLRNPKILFKDYVICRIKEKKQKGRHEEIATLPDSTLTTYLEHANLPPINVNEDGKPIANNAEEDQRNEPDNALSAHLSPAAFCVQDGMVKESWVTPVPFQYAPSAEIIGPGSIPAEAMFTNQNWSLYSPHVQNSSYGNNAQTSRDPKNYRGAKG